MADSIPSPYSETTKKHTRSRLAGGLVYRARVTDPQAPFSLHAAPRAHNLNACIAKNSNPIIVESFRMDSLT